MAKIPIRVTVNGQVRQSEVDPRLLLVHYLREELGLTGAKVGCDTSQCGACVVHMNGSSVKSCTLPGGASRRRGDNHHRGVGR